MDKGKDLCVDSSQLVGTGVLTGFFQFHPDYDNGEGFLVEDMRG